MTFVPWTNENKDWNCCGCNISILLSEISGIAPLKHRFIQLGFRHIVRDYFAIIRTSVQSRVFRGVILHFLLWRSYCRFYSTLCFFTLFWSSIIQYPVSSIWMKHFGGKYNFLIIYSFYLIIFFVTFRIFKD